MRKSENVRGSVVHFGFRCGEKEYYVSGAAFGALMVADDNGYRRIQLHCLPYEPMITDGLISGAHLLCCALMGPYGMPLYYVSARARARARAESLNDAHCRPD